MNRLNPRLFIGCALTLCALFTQAASHREAPSIALDPSADITDVYAFRNWNSPDDVVFIMNVHPGQEPGAGPNYFSFDDAVSYQIHLDTNRDGDAEDIVYQFRFSTELVPPFNDLPVPNAGGDDLPNFPPAITALGGIGALGFGSRQSYTVTETRAGVTRDLGAGRMVAVPSNMGPRTMPDYAGLAQQGIYDLENGGRVFSGQRDETFYIDLGAIFDTLNFRSSPVLNPTQDLDDGNNPFGNDTFSGFNVNSIAIEVPISDITDDPNSVIGVYASASRSRLRLLRGDGSSTGRGGFVQRARMGNPLINELVIGTGNKDRWNVGNPRNDADFLDFYEISRLALLLNAAYETDFPIAPRTDLVSAFLKYPDQDPGNCAAPERCADLLRLDLGVAPTAPAAQRRLGVLGGDPAGFPNGRRPNDDVTDIALRAVAGVFVGAVPPLGDGVNFNAGATGPNLTDNGMYTVFPFLPTPHDGRNRRHIDCGESGANDCGLAGAP